MEAPTGRIEEKARVAYLHQCQGVPSARALRALQAAGETVDLVTEKIELQGHKYSPGTLVVRVSSEKTHEVVLKVAQETGTIGFTASPRI